MGRYLSYPVGYGDGKKKARLPEFKFQLTGKNEMGLSQFVITQAAEFARAMPFAHGTRCGDTL
jgi:hypothetical protein